MALPVLRQISSVLSVCGFPRNRRQSRHNQVHNTHGHQIGRSGYDKRNGVIVMRPGKNMAHQPEMFWPGTNSTSITGGTQQAMGRLVNNLRLRWGAW